MGEIEDSKSGAPISERLFETISAAIISGELPAGSSVTEPELARRYGVSRAPLREALRLLEARYLVERNPYKGMRVVELTANRVRDLYEVREVLEGLACRRAAAVIVPAHISRLRDALAVERRTIARRAKEPADILGKASLLSFHAIIAEISGNEEVLRLLNSEIWRLIRADYHRHVHRPDVLRKSHVEHLMILRALSDRDADLAEILMRRHVVNTRLRRDQVLNGLLTENLEEMRH